MPFVAGFALGGLGAVLLARQSGANTRRSIRTFGRDACDTVKSGMAAVTEQQQEGMEIMSDFTNKAKHNIDDAADAAKRAVVNVVDTSKDLAHSAGKKVEEAGKKMEEAGKRLQNA